MLRSNAIHNGGAHAEDVNEHFIVLLQFARYVLSEFVFIYFISLDYLEDMQLEGKNLE